MLGFKLNYVSKSGPLFVDETTIFMVLTTCATDWMIRDLVKYKNGYAKIYFHWMLKSSAVGSFMYVWIESCIVIIIMHLKFQ